MQTRVVRGVATTIRHDADGTHVVYHATAVVTIHNNGDVTLRTGGWRTATTKARMNQAANQFRLGFTVYQSRFDWFVRVADTDIPFDDRELTLSAQMLRPKVHTSPSSPKCGECLMEHVAVVTLRADGSCPCCDRKHAEVRQ
jgi:hypothetical protein